MADQHTKRESYSQRDNPAFEALMAARKVVKEAAFFLPHLRPGMQVLDVGCGPGSITLGLAQAVAPGEVVGVDMQQSLVQRARDLAEERRITNVRFETGDAYGLSFPDGSFDAVFAHAVLNHLREPMRALAEMRRVLRPGGLVGVREPDDGTLLFTPAMPLLDQWLALMIRDGKDDGADPLVARHLRRLLLEAGFARAEASASVSSA